LCIADEAERKVKGRPKHDALILIDIINDFAFPKAGALRYAPEQPNTLPRKERQARESSCHLRKR
jgi:hypothetical protein